MNQIHASKLCLLQTYYLKYTTEICSLCTDIIYFWISLYGSPNNFYVLLKLVNFFQISEIFYVKGTERNKLKYTRFCKPLYM